MIEYLVACHGQQASESRVSDPSLRGVFTRKSYSDFGEFVHDLEESCTTGFSVVASFEMAYSY